MNTSKTYQLTSDLLPAIVAFIKVAAHGSFTRAAAEMAISPSALSQTISNLEKRLDARLLNRTTRSVSLTEAGKIFLADAEVGINKLDQAIDNLNESRDKPAGTLRINASHTAVKIILLPHLTDFMEAYPDINIELHCEDSFTDSVLGGFDAGIRLGEFLLQDMVGLPLCGPLKIATFASPRYLKNKELPQEPADLLKYRCLNIRFQNSGVLYDWEYTQNGHVYTIDVGGDLVSNDGDILLQSTIAGAGISCAFESLVQAEFDSGKLVPLLKPWWPTRTGFHIYYSSRLHLPRKLRVFIDFIRSRNGL